MRETGKRSRLERYDEDSEESGGKYKRPFPHPQEVSNNNQLVVYRILCPAHLIGSVIGRNGHVINSIRKQTNAAVNVVDPYPGAENRVILVYCHVKHRDLGADEEGGDGVPVCSAQDALLRVHGAILNAQDSLHAKTEFSNKNNTKEANILVPTSQASCIIGKSGAIIKKLRSNSRAFIKLSPKVPGDITQSCALSFDNFVQIRGGAEAVRKALYGISTIIYKHPSKETIPLETSIPELTPNSNIIVPSEFPVYPASSFYPAPDAAIPSGYPSLPILGPMPHGPELTFPADHHGPLPIYSSVLPVIPAPAYNTPNPAYNTPKCSGELVFRVLCPPSRIALVIGRAGSTIKGVRQESGARIDVDDAKNEESIITITSTEATDDVKSAAVEAVLLLQEKINDKDEDRMNIRLLVPNKVIGCLIGKGGSIIIDMRKKSQAEILISKGNKPQRASSSDELVEVFGDVDKLRDALVQIVLRLRENVFKESMNRPSSDKDRDDKLNGASTDPLYASSLSLPAVPPYSQQVAPMGYDQRGSTEQGGLDISPRSRSYRYSSLQVADEDYEGHLSYTAFEERFPHLEMTIPPSALPKVMGKRGSNLENIRKISGALIDIVESQSSRHDHIARISGTSEQRQSAKSLIQAFIMST